MTNEQKITTAINRCQQFNYQLRVSETGKRITHIINLDVRDPQLGPASNDRRMLLDIQGASKMSIKKIEKKIRDKWF